MILHFFEFFNVDSIHQGTPAYALILFLIVAPLSYPFSISIDIWSAGSTGGALRGVASLGAVVISTFALLLSPWLLAFGLEGAVQV